MKQAEVTIDKETSLGDAVYHQKQIKKIVKIHNKTKKNIDHLDNLANLANQLLPDIQ